MQVLATHPSDPAEYLRYVLNSGVDVNEAHIFSRSRSKDQEDGDRYLHGSALQQSCYHGTEACAETLLEYGADINFADCEFFGTPLQVVARVGKRSLAELLLDHGADINRAGVHLAHLCKLLYGLETEVWLTCSCIMALM